MATKTLANLLLGLGDFTRQIYIPRAQFAGTADTGGQVTALKDTELNVFADDFFNDEYWVYITGGAASGDIRNISDFAQSGGIITPDINFSAAPLSGSTYQIWKSHVDDVIDALNDALVSLNTRPDPRTGRKNKLYRQIVFTDLGHSLLTSNAASGQKDVIVADGALFFTGQKLTVKDDNNSEDATVASIASETLTMEDNLSNSYATADTAKVFAKSGNYFNVGDTLGVSRITGVFLQASSTSQRNPYREWKVVYTGAGVKQIYFPTAVSVDDQTWIVEAIGALETVTDPSDTVTIDSGRVDLLYAEAAYHLYRRFSDDISAGDFERTEALSQRYKAQVDQDFRGLWMPIPRELMSLKTDSDYD